MTAPHSISSGSDELLPCPFCGLPANLSRFRSGAANITQIQCDNDDKCAVCVDIKHINEAVAVEAWNTRTPALPSGEVEGIGPTDCAEHMLLQARAKGYEGWTNIYAAQLAHFATYCDVRAIASSPAPQIAGDWSWGVDYGKDLLHDLNQLAHANGTTALLRDGLQRAYKEISRLKKSQAQPTPPFSRWADTIESASLTISPKGSKELDALAAEVRAGGASQRPFDFGEGIQWRRVNDEPYEYAIQQGPHGDEFVKLLNDSCLCRTLVIPSTNHSPPDIQASHNSGERDPSVMPDWTGGETNNCGRCIRCLDEGFTATAEDPIPPSRKRMVVCQHCGNKRCPCATYHRNPCTDSNWAGQPGSIFGPALPSTQSGGAAK